MRVASLMRRGSRIGARRVSFVKGNILLKRNRADASAKGLSHGSLGGSVGLAFIGT